MVRSEKGVSEDFVKAMTSSTRDRERKSEIVRGEGRSRSRGAGRNLEFERRREKRRKILSWRFFAKNPFFFGRERSDFNPDMDLDGDTSLPAESLSGGG